jgi:hypothetical protein
VYPSGTAYSQVFTGVLFRVVVVTELVSKLLGTKEKFRHLAIRLHSSQKCIPNLYGSSDTGAPLRTLE